MATLNVHGDPMPSYAVGSIPSALAGSQKSTAVIVIRQKESDLATPARSTCSRLILSANDILIGSSRRRRRGIIWPISRGRTAWKMLVSQKHIGNLSPRWNAALKQNRMCRPFCRGFPVYAFENVDPRAMGLVLYIAHFNTHWLPQELSLMEIIQLARLADHYDLNHILVGYLERWIEPHRHRILDRGYEQWLFVAWQFGLEDDYLLLANHMAVFSAVNDDGELRYPFSKRHRPVRGLFPMNALTVICSARTLVLNAVIRTTQDFLNELILNSDNSLCANRRAHPTDRATCVARSSNNLQRFLVHSDLPPKVLAADKHLESVQYYLRVVADQNIDQSIMDRGGINLAHAECRVGEMLRRRLEQTMESARWAASAELLTHLRANGAKRGKPCTRAMPHNLVGYVQPAPRNETIPAAPVAGAEAMRALAKQKGGHLRRWY